jgi:glycosyltransferase involved in cell wall biosynthesis
MTSNEQPPGGEGSDAPSTKVTDVKAALKLKLGARLGNLVQQQSTGALSNLHATLPTIVSTVVSAHQESGQREKGEKEKAEVKGGLASFFPSSDDKAREVLSRIGGTEDIIVVPNSFNLQGSNKAITIKSEDQVERYRATIVSAAKSRPEVDGLATGRRLVINTILVKDELLGLGELEVCGQIWHEHGHVLFDAKESGNVFAHEISCLRKHFPDSVVEWVTKTRKLAYLARYSSDPGMDQLINTLQQVLPELEFIKFMNFYKNLDEPVAPKDTVHAEQEINVGTSTLGMIDDLKRKLGLPPESPDTIHPDVKEKDEIPFGPYTWRVEKIMAGEVPAENEYTLRRLT